MQVFKQRKKSEKHGLRYTTTKHNQNEEYHHAHFHKNFNNIFYNLRLFCSNGNQ